jgi:hypothetical protein
MRNLLLVATASLAGCIATGTTAQAFTVTPAYEFTTNTTITQLDNRQFTNGFSFSLSTPESLNALGVWKGDVAASQQVGLWSSTGTLLGSTTVLSTDTTVGNYRWAPFSLALAAGSYVIGATFSGGPFPLITGGLTTLAGYSYGGDLYDYGAGLNFPTKGPYGTYGLNGISNPNFSIVTAPPVTVPEPATLAILAAGLFGVAATGRRRPA